MEDSRIQGPGGEVQLHGIEQSDEALGCLKDAEGRASRFLESKTCAP